MISLESIYYELNNTCFCLSAFASSNAHPSPLFDGYALYLLMLILASHVFLLALFSAYFAETASICFYLAYNKLDSSFLLIFITKNIFFLRFRFLSSVNAATACYCFQ